MRLSTSSGMGGFTVCGSPIKPHLNPHQRGDPGGTTSWNTGLPQPASRSFPQSWILFHWVLQSCWPCLASPFLL